MAAFKDAWIYKNANNLEERTTLPLLEMEKLRDKAVITKKRQKIRLWSPCSGTSARGLIFRDLQKHSSPGPGDSFSIEVTFF